MRSVGVAVLLALGGGVWAQAQGDEEGQEWRKHRWLISLGGYEPTYVTKLILEGSGGGLVGGTLEDLVGLDSRIGVIRLDASYQLSEREWWQATYFASKRTATATLQQDVRIGDVVFPAGSGVRSYVSEDQLQITYRNRFYRKGQFSVSASAGLYVSKFGAGVDSLGGSKLAEDVAVTAPLPVIGLALDYKISPMWSLVGQTEGLKVKVGAIEGDVLDTRLSVHYMDKGGWGGGLGYNARRIAVRASIERLNGEFSYTYSGPFAFVSRRF